MPRIAYSCKKCDIVKKKFYGAGKTIRSKIKCECGGDAERQLSSPSQKSTIVVDNGLQPRSVELDRNIVEVIEDREDSSYKRRGDAVLEKLI